MRQIYKFVKYHKDLLLSHEFCLSQVHDQAIVIANEMWSNGSNPKPSLPQPSADDLQKGQVLEVDRNDYNLK